MSPTAHEDEAARWQRQWPWSTGSTGPGFRQWSRQNTHNSASRKGLQGKFSCILPISVDAAWRHHSRTLAFGGRTAWQAPNTANHAAKGPWSYLLPAIPMLQWDLILRSSKWDHVNQISKYMRYSVESLSSLFTTLKIKKKNPFVLKG